ncbi:TonB-dependent siderophore receptor [Polaromonas sp. A23]|uniref:TonB-dependent receptor n=1 Tax=Polaromonas sp. A23 TaxID=1944133 RepID=UPI00098715CD|nr:TonB-dependent siderophore receptor [Polaromonas sp. A23]OOG36571.1 TonB-dependent siderophore receptor [Polaromonas sp. A23]
MRIMLTGYHPRLPVFTSRFLPHPPFGLVNLLAPARRVAVVGLLGISCLGEAQAQAQAVRPVTEEAVESVKTEGSKTLSEVIVREQRADGLPAPYAGGQAARGARLGLLGNTDIMKTPFSVSSYTAQMIQDRQAGTVADVLAADSSVRSTGQTGGLLDAFFIRGFPIGEGNVGEIAFDGQYGVAPNYRLFTDYIERVEVLKGPGALLYGMSPNSGIGGVINVVPKRALKTDLTRFTADYASGPQGGGHLDVSRRFGADRQFGVRVNAGHQQGDTAVDKQSRKASVGAAALDFQGERLSASLDLISQVERFDAPSRPFLLPAASVVPAAPDGRRNVTQAWEWSKVEDQSALLRAEYELSDKLTVFANAGGGKTTVARLFGTSNILNAAGDTSTVPAYFRFDIDRATADTGVRARFDTAAIRHAVTLQVSSYRDRLDRGSTNGTAVLSNIYSPVERAAQNVAPPAQVSKISETTLSGAALSDTLSMLDDRVLLTIGARQQRVKSDNFNPATGALASTYEKSAVTPLAGLVVKPWQNVSLYANYIEGLSKGDVAPQTASNAGVVFAPYKSRQHEIGVKFDHGALITTASLFQIEKPSGQLTGNVFAVDAEQRNRGLELNMLGQATPGIRLLGGVTLIDAKLTRTNSAATLGKTPVGVPAVQANLGAEWDTSWVGGLTLTAGAFYTGEQSVNQANTQEIPAWTRIDLGARYTTKISGKQTVFRASLQNAFNKAYWSGVASYGAFVQGAPRTLLMSAAVDF